MNWVDGMRSTKQEGQDVHLGEPVVSVAIVDLRSHLAELYRYVSRDVWMFAFLLRDINQLTRDLLTQK
jgi:hypothetical protein